MAAVERELGNEVYALDDTEEDEGHIRIAGPRIGIPPTTFPVKGSSASGKSKSSTQGTEGTPVQIKFGPPKNAKKIKAPAPNTASPHPTPLIASPAIQSLSKTVVPTASMSGTLNAGDGSVSRGPSPPISRLPTPSPPIDIGVSFPPPMLPVSALETAPAALHRTSLPVRSTSVGPTTAFPPQVVHGRASSEQPGMPPNWNGCNFIGATPDDAPASDQSAVDRTPMVPNAAVELSGISPPNSISPTIAAFPATSVLQEFATNTPSSAASGTNSLPEVNKETEMSSPTPTDGSSHLLPPGAVAVPSIQDLFAVQTQQKGRKRKGTSVAAAQAKQRKTSNDTSPSSLTGGSATSSTEKLEEPPWFANSRKLFQTAVLGPEWDLLVSKWVSFEESDQLQGTGKLGTQHRPPIIREWIQRARASSYNPDIKDVKRFATDFAAWWKSVQPDWRRADSNGNLIRQDGDWGNIHHSGANGLLSVVAALFFWGKCVRGTPACAAWRKALDDVLFVFEQLT